MPKPFTITCITPSSLCFQKSTEIITLETQEGSFGIMARHQPMLAVLKNPSLVSMRLGSKVNKYEVHEGILHVRPDSVVLLAKAVSPWSPQEDNILPADAPTSVLSESN